MSAPEDLQDIYTDELKDLWSANDQMKKVLKKSRRRRVTHRSRKC
ncbi:hypothetical protein SPHINGO391_510080 [Sphingomonas aurantiaca]|uniref:Uncharacterized protein n=1 Tax=Sphingomonas aurantiaca TaxID=185949 RepID=A0A5E8ADJ3_9SPHN|nr:hypothetical protein SPHINGO391_510080 [Sphingomonas aurantiaca]